MTAKLYENLDMDAYHAHSDIKKLGEAAVLSKSMIAVFDECAAKFEDQFILGNRPAPTNEMELGSASGFYAMQREIFDAKYYIMPLKEDGTQIIRNKRNADFKEQLAIAAGRAVLQPSDMVQIKGIADSMSKSPKAVELLGQPGRVECSIFFRDPQTGLQFRCRPDFSTIPLDVVTDMKATGRADNRGIEKISFDKRYDLSVAITARGIKELTGEYPRDYWFLFVETKRPFVIETRSSFSEVNYMGGSISKSYWQIGEERLSRLLDRYMASREAQFYPSYNAGPLPMTAPDYEVHKLYHTDEEIEV